MACLVLPREELRCLLGPGFKYGGMKVSESAGEGVAGVVFHGACSTSTRRGGVGVGAGVACFVSRGISGTDSGVADSIVVSDDRGLSWTAGVSLVVVWGVWGGGGGVGCWAASCVPS